MSAEERVSYRDKLAEALRTTPTTGHKYTPGQERFDHHPKPGHHGHNYLGTCALCLGDVDALADAVLAVRDAELDRLSQENDRLAAELKSVLNAAADRLDKLPVGGEALKGPYWYRQGVHDAANLLRDWADASGSGATL